jgi:hypothetical protein
MPEPWAKYAAQRVEVDDYLKTRQPIDGGGGGGDDGRMESRVTRLEVIAESTEKRLGSIDSALLRHDSKFDGIRDRQERDFRLLFGALIVATLGLAGLMAKGFGWL